MKQTLLVILTALAVVLAGGVSLAQPCLGGGGPKGPRAQGPHGPGMSPERLAWALDLTDEQVEAVEALHEATISEPDPALREAIEARRAELQELWSAEAPDRTAILSKMEEIDALRDQIRDAHRAERVDFRIGMLEILTPEQRDKLAERHELRRERPRRGPGGRRGGGPR